MSVYLINAAQPRFATVQITRQKRNANQSAGEIEFTLSSVPPKDCCIHWTASVIPLKNGIQVKGRDGPRFSPGDDKARFPFSAVHPAQALLSRGTSKRLGRSEIVR